MAGDSDRWSALAWAIAIHLLLFGLITLGLSSRKPVGISAPPIIQATAVSEEQVMEPQRRRQAEEAARKKRIAEEKRRAEEIKRQAELQKKQEAEKARLAALDKQRKMEAERKAAEEAKRKAEEEKQLAIAEEAKKRQEAEERLKAQMAAEAQRLEYEAKRLDSARLSRLQDQYVADITNKVQRNWLRPPDSRGTFCSVVINQIPGGEIVGTRVTDCDGDVSFQRSVEAAVRKSSPLPMPREPELFQREIEFVFRPAR